jgi:hypothetical protein
MSPRICKWKILEALLAAALSFAVPASAGAADEIAKLCGVPITPSPEFERATLIDQTASDIASGHEQVAFNRIADTYERSLRPAEKATPAADDFVRQLRAPTSRWSALWEISNDDNGDAILFERDTTARKVTIPCRQRPLLAYFHDMAAIANYLHIALAAREAPEKQAQWNALKKQATDHEDLIRNGLPMWPWELWLNGKRLGKSDADPLFKTQLVFLRPTAGVEVNTRSRGLADLEGSLLLEPIGFVRYIDDSQYSKWWGVSAVVTATTGQGMGYGALFRYGRYSAGLTLHHSEVAGVSNDVYLAFSMDLYGLIEQKREELPGLRDGIKKSFSDLLK